MNIPIAHLAIAAALLALVGLAAMSHDADAAPQQSPAPPAAAVPAGPAAEQPVDHALIDAQNAVGLHLFGALAPNDEEQNTFISPTSAALALALAYNGAKGQTQQQMAIALALQGMSLDQLNQANRTLLAQLPQLDPKVKLTLANSIWVRHSGGLQPKPDFVQRVRQNYEAEVGDLAGAPANVNAWVRHQTQGKIDNIVRESDVQNAVAVLVNAVYFKGEWTHKFDPSATRSAVFTTLDGSKRDVPMMHNTNLTCSYLHGDGFQALRVPYGNGRLNALLFLPDAGTKFNDFTARLTPENWAAWTTQFAAGTGSLGLPRFRSEYEADLKRPLTALGMGDAFKQATADFSGLAGDPGVVWIGKAVQKTYLEVNEQGTEAAAATGIVMRARAVMRTAHFDLTFDRPFIFTIQDSRTGALIFLGRIVDPKS